MPWQHLYDVTKLPRYAELVEIYKDIGNLIKQYDIRVSFHPDHFTVLASLNPVVAESSIQDMNHHSYLLDLIDAPVSRYSKINIHISNTKPSKREAIERFIKSYDKLDHRVKQRITVENDDNKNGYTVRDLYELYERIGIPIVFDSLHYACNSGDQTYQEALDMACSTWGDITPVVHHSSSKVREVPDADPAAHSDYIFEPFEACGNQVDIMLEAKAKNLALKRYCEQYII